MLRVAENGLAILRRRKHEWSDALRELPPDQFALKTGKKWGSKFSAAWTLDVLVDWIDAQVRLYGWTSEVQSPSPIDVRTVDVVGWCDGQPVRTIRIVCDGRYIHAYPIKDAP